MSEMGKRRVADSQVTMSQLMGPQQANTLGNVHGGVIMHLCDEAAGMSAVRYSRRPSVTVAVDSMTFTSPVHIGNLVTVTAKVSWVGRTSMEVEVLVAAEDVLSGDVTYTNTAYFVYVSLDDEGKPMPAPRPIYETSEEKDMAARAEKRRALRLQLRKDEEAI
ncbi:MAG TPA: acyl-CoA thioesterase [Anaerolineae bacterium]|nr:acyl-CoA thioesterase [Anaerolineae bacterium]